MADRPTDQPTTWPTNRIWAGRFDYIGEKYGQAAGSSE